MAKFKFKVEMEIDIEDSFIEEGYNIGDMIYHEVGSALNGSDIEEWDVIDIEPVN
jgi:hypothetical protein